MSELLNHPMLQPIWLLILVLALEQLWIWPDKYHPLSLARLLATRMAEKVHFKGKKKSGQTSEFQQKISGTLAFLVLLLPLLSILLIIIYLAEFPLFFDGILLLLALQFQGSLKQGRKISDALAADKKALARELLAKLVLRETHKLSAVGIAKASIESLLLRFNQHYCSVIFYYFLLGSLGALTYRLLYEFSHCWNRKLVDFRHFSQPVSSLVAILQWLPVRLACLALVLGQNFSAAVKAYFGFRQEKGRHKSTHMFSLNLEGGSLGIELGGPAYYEGRKVRSAKCGGARQVRHMDIQRTIHAIQKAKLVIVVLSFLGATLLYAWQSVP